MTKFRAAVPSTLALCLMLSLGACTESLRAQEAAMAASGARTLVPTAAGEELVEAEIVRHGRIVEVDVAGRLVTLVDEAGDKRRFRVDDEAGHLEGIQAGDEVEVYYRRSLLFSMQPAGTEEPGAYLRQEEVRPDGDRPGVTESEVVTVLSPLVAVDVEGHTISVQAPNGSIHVLDVEEQRHREALPQLNVGDMLRIEFHRQLSVRITPGR